MQLESILNRVEPLKSFVYKEQRLVEVPGGQPFLEVDIEPRANGRPICSGCGKKRPGYDKLAARRFEFVPLWNMAVYFAYVMPRVDCPTCGVVVERVPWAEGKGHLTTSYRWFLARWAKRLAWTGYGSRLQHDLGERVSLRKTCSGEGRGPPGSLGHRGDRCG